MIGRVYLHDKWWAHNGLCSEVQIGEHIHYGENVIVSVSSEAVPDDVLAEYIVMFGDPSKERPRGVLNP